MVPNPTVWTLFTFLHFLVATLFIAAGIWMYTNITLDDTFRAPLVSIVLLFMCWLLLYVSGRLGRKAGHQEMRALQSLRYNALSNKV